MPSPKQSRERNHGTSERNIDSKDPQLTIIVEGPVYPKRRMIVVLWIHERDFFAMPLYAFGKASLTAKPHSLLNNLTTRYSIYSNRS